MDEENKLPNWMETRNRMPALLRVLVPLEYLTAWFYYLFKASTLVRFTIESGAATAVIVGLIAFFNDLEDRKEERLARMWNLATNKVEGNSGKIPALEFLVKKGKPLQEISIPGAFLQKANLTGANLTSANLSGVNFGGAILIDTDLRWAKLKNANLGEADLSGANLLEAELTGANISDAKLRYSIGLIQGQIDGTCVGSHEQKVELPPGILPPQTICPIKKKP